MQVVDLPLHQLQEAAWNPNQMDEAMLARLRQSIKRYGIVENLVVRKLGENTYEAISGNQRLKMLREMGFSHAPCVVVDLDDAQARLLAQALNHIQGEDDLGLRAELLRKVLETIPETDVVAVLPENAVGLRALASIGQEAIAGYLQNWQRAQQAKLKHLVFQLTPAQLKVVQEALTRVMPTAGPMKGDNPNARGTALYLLCQAYLEKKASNGS
jgi:ParB family chromosome partitioning protein